MFVGARLLRQNVRVTTIVVDKPHVRPASHNGLPVSRVWQFTLRDDENGWGLSGLAVWLGMCESKETYVAAVWTFGFRTSQLYETFE